jgi:hypothetical protein
MKYAVEVSSVATKFHKGWFRHSVVDRRGYTDTQTQSKVI